MIKLACNYMTEVMELIDENKIDIDLIKYPSLANDEGFKDLNIYKNRIEQIKKYRPVLYHGSYPANVFIGDKDFKEKFNLEAFLEICTLSKTSGISLHFCGGKPTYTKLETIKIAVENINYLKFKIPKMKFISIENLPRTQNPHETDPDVIREIVERANIYFLYDISHAYKYSYDNKINFEEYVSKLPLHRLYEMHINGWKEKDGDIQAHMCILDELYKHIEYIAKESTVQIMTLEYGRPNDRINCGCPIIEIGKSNAEAKKEVEYQLKRLREIIDRLNVAK